MVAEGGALALLLIGVALILLRRIKSPLMHLYAISLAFLAQSSPGFHPVQAVGALVVDGALYFRMRLHAAELRRDPRLSFHAFVRAGVQRRRGDATTGGSQSAGGSDCVEQCKSRQANLEILASTDHLTGINNRRSFIERSQIEVIARATLRLHP